MRLRVLSKIRAVGPFRAKLVIRRKEVRQWKKKKTGQVLLLVSLGLAVIVQFKTVWAILIG